MPLNCEWYHRNDVRKLLLKAIANTKKDVETLINKAIYETTVRIIKEDIMRLDYIVAMQRKKLKDLDI